MPSGLVAGSDVDNVDARRRTSKNAGTVPRSPPPPGPQKKWAVFHRLSVVEQHAHSQNIASTHIGTLRMTRIAVKQMLHTNSGICTSLIPAARIPATVTNMLIEPKIELKPFR
ncbi:MAG: hypothetical protein WDW36_007427 [Sanguina aurantia]